MAERPTKCSMRRMTLRGQIGLGQKVSASPSIRSTGVVQAGHVVGIAQGTVPAGRKDSITLSTCGITSPRALDEHRIADANIALANIVFIMQGGLADRDATDLHRHQGGMRHEPAGASPPALQCAR